MSSNVILPGGIFRNVLILESRDWWQAVQATYDPTRDLVLTYDFGLRKEVEALGGTVRYVDHLCEQGVMQANNFLMYQFFGDWHKASSGRDIFRYREVDFGFSFRIEIWNDFTFYVRGRLCLEQLRTISYQTVIVGSSQGLIGDVLKDMGLDFQSLEQPAEFSRQAYFFPVHRWMNERLRIRRVRHVIRDVVVAVQGVVMSWIDRVAEYFSPTVRIYVQEYYPTKELLQCLKRESGIRVVQGHFSGVAGLMKFLAERPIPIYGSLNEYQKIAYLILAAFQQQRSARLVLSNGIDVTSQVNQVIEQRVAEVLPGMLRTLDCVIRYLNRHPIQLEILIANLGQVAMLVDCVAKSRGVPSFLIINGLLSSEYLDEGKYATVINSYSESIRDHYFRGMGNVVCLGDPRMDAYALASPRMINRTLPTITIGASGFNNVDLNSYLAVEFEFLNDVLSAIRNLSNATRSFRVILKIRANGYHDAYRRFAAEYFPGIVDSIIDNAPMRAVLEQTDFFVSIFSQTLFEASCLGIPSVYHKNDREIMDPPFDGKSELVTTYDVAGLEQAILDFLSGSDRFDAFLDKQVMEKYVGPLDGGNLERNLRFTHGLLGKCQGGRGERR